MAIKITCDICGKDITERTDATLFDDYQFCERCYRAIEPKRNAWKLRKHCAFIQFFADEIDQIMPQKKEKTAKHTHVCQCAKVGSALVTTVAKGKCHCHRKTRKAIYGTADIAKQIGRSKDVVCHYATRNQIGMVVHGVRVYDEEQAEHIRRHFVASEGTK